MKLTAKERKILLKLLRQEIKSIKSVKALTKYYDLEKKLTPKIVEYQEIKELKSIYVFFDLVFRKTDKGLQLLSDTMDAFNNDKSTQSEIKTLLIISAPFKENPVLKESRDELLSRYKKLKP